MNIVLIGCGTIGRTILEELNKEGHTITIIDEDKEKVAKLIEKFDVSGVAGNGASLEILQAAGAKNADLLVATTTSDEINILSCLVGEKMGAKHTIARVRKPEYYKQGTIFRDELGIDLIVNPEHEIALEIASMINLPSASKIERFASGKVTVLEISVEEGSPLVGQNLIEIRKKLETKILICAIQRGEEVIIPTGKSIIQVGDKIHVTADTASLNSFITELNLIKVPLKNVLIIGGNKISYYLGRELSAKRHSIKIIDKDKAICEELAELLPKAEIINDDGTNHDVLLEEGIESMDAFVSLTDVDEENIIVSMYAKTVNVKKAIAKVKREGLVGIVDDLGAIISVSPKNIVANKVISYVRALSNRRGSNVISLYRLINGNVEAVEFIAKQDSKLYGVPFRELNMVDNTLVACIIRDNKVIIPDGNEYIKLNDGVVIVTTHKDFEDLTEVFK